jgi:hypothetical protein
VKADATYAVRANDFSAFDEGERAYVRQALFKAKGEVSSTPLGKDRFFSGTPRRHRVIRHSLAAARR